MKKFICILFLLAFSRQASCQILIAILFGDKLNTGKLEFGLIVSPALHGISNIESERDIGLNLGIYFNIRPDRKFFIHAEGIAKGSLGAKNLTPYPTGNDTLDELFTGGAVERKIKSFSLPVLLRYAMAPKFFAEAGVQANLMISAKDIFRAKINDSELNYTIKVSDQVTLFDFGLAAGFHYQFKKSRSMGIGLRYFQGITDMLKSVSGLQANSAWLLNITVPIGTGKPNAPGN